MYFREPMRLAGFALLAGLILIISGCAGAPTTAQAPVNPTIVVVQYVTQVVATVTTAPPTATPIPATQSASAASGGYDPFSVKPYYPIPGCPMASRLSVGEVAVVAASGGPYGIHFSRDIGFSPMARRLNQGELLYIIGDPTCNKNGLVWEVLADADDTKGFVVEGDGETYWLLPYGETYDQKEIRERLKKLEN